MAFSWGPPETVDYLAKNWPTHTVAGLKNRHQKQLHQLNNWSRKHYDCHS